MQVFGEFAEKREYRLAVGKMKRQTVQIYMRQVVMPP